MRGKWRGWSLRLVKDEFFAPSNAAFVNFTQLD